MWAKPGFFSQNDKCTIDYKWNKHMCMEFEPKIAACKAQTNLLSYCGPTIFCCSVCDQEKNIISAAFEMSFRADKCVGNWTHFFKLVPLVPPLCCWGMDTLVSKHPTGPVDHDLINHGLAEWTQQGSSNMCPRSSFAAKGHEVLIRLKALWSCCVLYYVKLIVYSLMIFKPV